MKKPLTDEQIKKLTQAFRDIDFTQPNAHIVYRYFQIVLSDFMTTPSFTTDREYYFYKLGFAVALATQRFQTIPPINCENQSEVAMRGRKEVSQI